MEEFIYLHWTLYTSIIDDLTFALNLEISIACLDPVQVSALLDQGGQEQSRWTICLGMWGSINLKTKDTKEGTWSMPPRNLNYSVCEFRPQQAIRAKAYYSL